MTNLEVDIRGSVGALAIELAFRTSEAPLVLVGPNGAGKTCALMMILGALRPQSGRVALEDTSLFDAARAVDVPVEQRRIGFFPQRYALFPHLDVLENVAYGVPAGPRAARRESALRALRDLDVAGLAGRRPHQLSGGEAQRVALARALANQPRALLLDEPLAALDVSVRRDVRRFLSQQLRAWGIPTVVVTHDRADAESLDGDIIVLEAGAVIQRGRLADLSAAPRSPFVRELTGV
jgi:molybdate transport system ATP-binding protein